MGVLSEPAQVINMVATEKNMKRKRYEATQHPMLILKVLGLVI